MPRITEEEKENFHKLLDMSLEKLDNPKNINKSHWKFLDKIELLKNIQIECGELDLAIYKNDILETISELDDIVNFALFMKYNLLIKQEFTTENTYMENNTNCSELDCEYNSCRCFVSDECVLNKEIEEDERY